MNKFKPVSLSYWTFLETVLYQHNDGKIKSLDYHHQSINGYDLRYAMRRHKWLS